MRRGEDKRKNKQKRHMKQEDDKGKTEEKKEKAKLVQKGSTNSITSWRGDAADGAVRSRGSRQAIIHPTCLFVCFSYFSSLVLLVQSQGRSKFMLI